MSTFIMCLSCGKKLANDKEALEHSAFWLAEEQRTQYLEPSQRIYRHQVQISQPQGVVNGLVGRSA